MRYKHALAATGGASLVLEDVDVDVDGVKGAVSAAGAGTVVLGAFKCVQGHLGLEWARVGLKIGVGWWLEGRAVPSAVSFSTAPWPAGGWRM